MDKNQIIAALNVLNLILSNQNITFATREKAEEQMQHLIKML